MGSLHVISAPVIVSAVVVLRRCALSLGPSCGVCSGPKGTLQPQLSQELMRDCCEEMSEGGDV